MAHFWALQTLSVLCTIQMPIHDAKMKLGISQFELNQFELFAQYAGAAYCYDNIYGMGNTVACTAEGGDCPTVESAKPSI